MKCILSQYQGGSLSEAADLDVALWDVYASNYYHEAI